MGRRRSARAATFFFFQTIADIKTVVSDTKTLSFGVDLG